MANDQRKDHCKIHGKHFWLMAKMAGCQVCAACVVAGFYVPEISNQIKADFPSEILTTKYDMGYKPCKTCDDHAPPTHDRCEPCRKGSPYGAVMAIYPGSDPT